MFLPPGLRSRARVGGQICRDHGADADEFRGVGKELIDEPPDFGLQDRQRRSAVLLALPEVEHQAVGCLQVDDDGPDVTGLNPVELVERSSLSPAAASLLGSNEFRLTTAYIRLLLFFSCSGRRGRAATRFCSAPPPARGRHSGGDRLRRGIEGLSELTGRFDVPPPRCRRSVGPGR